MKVLKPAFIEGIHWRRLTREERAGAPWKYILLVDMEFRLESPVCGTPRILMDFVGRVWGIIRPLSLIVKRGYSWNGCSWSPDWELLSSLPHDLLYQFSGCLDFPELITRRWADDLFYALCHTPVGFLYLAGLRTGSRWWWGRRPIDGETIAFAP